MDAGVLQLHVFEHQAAQRREPILGPEEEIEPTLTAAKSDGELRDVSLVVPTFYNNSLKRAALTRLVDGIDACRSVREIVLVAAGGGKQEIPDLPTNKPVKIVPCDPNRRAQARNLGAENAQHDVVMFMDDDMLLHSWSSVDAMVSALVGGEFDAALFPRRNYARFPQLYGDESLDALIRHWRNGKRAWESDVLYDPTVHGAAFRTMAFCFPGCFMIIRKDAYEAIGGFPEEFHGWGFEDSDFAIRATAVLRVLNLFRKTEPMLHVDHPVSPYKSEEYQENFQRFLRTHSMNDVDRLCDTVIAGEDYQGDGSTLSERSKHHLQPLDEVLNADDVRVGPSDTLRERMRRNFECVQEIRMEKSLTRLPSLGVLHGSRGMGRERSTSDYDLLFLFQEGNLREYYVDIGDDGRVFELEYADFGKFESIAQQPVMHPLYGPMEMAKLVQGKLLFGDRDHWLSWRQEQVRLAVEYGRLYWMLYAVGMTLNSGDAITALRAKLSESLALLLEMDDPHRFAEEIVRLRSFKLEEVGEVLRYALDTEMPAWLEDLNHSRRYFAFQVPEVWTAMRWLAQRPRNRSLALSSSSVLPGE